MKFKVDDETQRDVEATPNVLLRNNAGPPVAAQPSDQLQLECQPHLNANNISATETFCFELVNEPNEFLHTVPYGAQPEEQRGQSHEPDQELRRHISLDYIGSRQASADESKSEKLQTVLEIAVDKEVDEGDTIEDESSYPSGSSLAILTTGLCLATFVVALDNTILATAIPSITTAFESLDDIGWYASAYLLTTTSLQPSFGKIYAHFNVKWIYLIALVLFELGSVICATAKNSPMLIVGRAVAGTGAAALFSGAMTILGFSVPLRKRAMYLTSLSSMFGIASVIGPILGGALTDKLTWRWCFWINLPFGGTALLVVFFFFKLSIRQTSSLTFRQKLLELDILGASFLVAGVVCLLLALQWGGTTLPWRSSRVIGLMIGFGLFIIIFIAIQYKLGEKATIPPRLFIKQRTVLSSSLYSCFLGMGMYIHIYYLPFYFQAIKSVSAEVSGIRTIPYLISLTFSSVIVGAAITRVGYYPPFMWFGAAVFTIGAGILFTLEVQTSTAEWIGYQILAGAGAGAGIQVPFIAVQTVTSSSDMPSGNAIIVFFTTLGGAIAISLAQNVFASTLVTEITRKTSGVDPMSIINAGATHFRDVVPPNQLSSVLNAYDIAIDNAFIPPIATGIAALITSAFVEWKTMKKKRVSPSAP